MKSKNDKVEVLAEELSETGEIGRLKNELAEAVQVLEAAVEKEKNIKQLVASLENEHQVARQQLDAALQNVTEGFDVEAFTELMGREQALEKICKAARAEQGVVDKMRWARERACKLPFTLANGIHEALTKIAHKRACKQLEGTLSPGGIPQAAWSAKSVALVSFSTKVCPPSNNGEEILESAKRVLEFARNYR